MKLLVVASRYDLERLTTTISELQLVKFNSTL